MKYKVIHTTIIALTIILAVLLVVAVAFAFIPLRIDRETITRLMEAIIK